MRPSIHPSFKHSFIHSGRRIGALALEQCHITALWHHYAPHHHDSFLLLLISKIFFLCMAKGSAQFVLDSNTNLEKVSTLHVTHHNKE
jgi:hypothetical protein